MKPIIVNGASYDPEEVSSYKSYDDFKKDSDLQTFGDESKKIPGNPTVHFGNFPAAKRDELLKLVWDQSKAAVAPAPAAPAARTPAPATSGGGTGK